MATADRSTFARIKNVLFLESEEVRYDIPSTFANGTSYIGLAPFGTLTSDPKWAVVRTDMDANGNPSRDRFRLSLAWDDRATGWI